MTGALRVGYPIGRFVTVAIALSFENCPVVEFRRYTLRPGALPDLLAVFEGHLIEPQEAAGLTVGGTFVDEDDPDCFTWLRGFADHGTRVRGLEAFYGGPVWARHHAAANATMVDSDDVLLLRPTVPPHRPGDAVPRGGTEDRPRPERILVGTCGSATDADSLENWFATTGVAGLEEVLGVRIATWRTDPHANGFPQLPVREEQAIAWLAVFPDGDTRDVGAGRLIDADVTQELDRRTSWRRIFRLSPSPRSAHPATRPHQTRAAAVASRPAGR